MAINKVLDKNKNVILDLTNDTVDSTHLAAGFTAHNKNGQIVVGTMEAKDIIMRGDPVVTFYDYDGNIVYEYSREEFLSLEELPPLPELTAVRKQQIKNSYATTLYDRSYINSNDSWPFYYIIDHIQVSRWSNTLEELKYALTNGMDGAQVAALYDTDDDSTILVCTNNNNNFNYKYFRLYFSQSVSRGVEVDWGDGSEPETFESYGNTNISAYHDYSWYARAYRPYIIKLKVKEGKLGFGYRRYRNWETGEYTDQGDYGYSYPCEPNSYWGIGAWFGKNVVFGHMQYSDNWGSFRSVLGGVHNVEMDQTWSYSKSGNYLYCLQPVIVPHNTWVHRPDRASGLYWYKSVSGKVVLPVNYEKPQNLRTDSNGWLRSTGENMAGYYGSTIYLPLAYTGGAYLGYYDTSTASYMPKYIYPPNFKPECAYACANQGEVFTQLKVVGYLQDGILQTATGCFSRTTSLIDFTCPYNADYPTLPNQLFNYCYNLVSIKFEDGTKIIPQSICYGCSKLSYVYIPSSVTTINSSAFDSTSSNLVVEIEPAVSGRQYNGSWIYNNTNVRIYYNGNWEHWVNEMLYGDQPANFQGVAYLFYVLDENGPIEYKGRNYKRLIDCNIPEDFVLPAHKEVISLSWLSQLPNIKNLVINADIALTTISQMPNYSECMLDGVYFEGSISDWFNLKFSNSESQSSNPMSCAEHLYIADGSGTIERYGKYYREITELTAPVRSDGSNIYVEGYKIHGYNGGIHKLIIPEGTTYISNYAIRYNNAINEIVLPETLRTIYSYSMQYNYGLSEIDIPASVTSIGYAAFHSCCNLTKVILNRSTMPSIESEAFRYCYHLVEIENHTNVNLDNYKGNWSSYGGLCCYLLHTMSDPAQSYVYTDANGNVIYDNGSSSWWMAWKATNGIMVCPTQVKNGFYTNNSGTIYTNNNFEKLVYPERQNYSFSNDYIWNRYRIKYVEIGSSALSTITVPSHKLKTVITTSDNWTPFYRYSPGQYYYTWPLGETYTIKSNVSSLGKALSTESFGCKRLIIEPSDTPLNWDFQAYYNTFISLESDVIDLTARPINVNYGSWMFYQGPSYLTRQDLKLKTLKLRCNSNFYQSNGYGLFYFVQDIEKVILSGEGLTNINYYIFRGEMPNFKWLELPESLTSLTGAWLSQFPVSDHDFTVTFKTAEPPTMTSDFMQQSNIGSNNRLTFRVPQGSLEAYSTATNWPGVDQITYVEYDPATGEDITD